MRVVEKLVLWECPACGRQATDRQMIDDNGVLTNYACCGRPVDKDDKVVKITYYVEIDTREEDDFELVKPVLYAKYRLRNIDGVKRKYRGQKCEVIYIDGAIVHMELLGGKYDGKRLSAFVCQLEELELFCGSCEQYFPASQLDDGECPCCFSGNWCYADDLEEGVDAA